MSSPAQNQNQTQTVSVPANVPPPYVNPPTPPAPQQVVAQPQITPEQRAFLEALNELISSAQELSYEMATLDPDVMRKAPEIRDLINAGRKVVVAVKKLHNLIRARTTG